MLRKILIGFVGTLIALQVQSNNLKGIFDLRLGSEDKQAKSLIIQEYGEPKIQRENTMDYQNLKFKGRLFNDLTFRFKSGKLIDMRFFINATNKQQADKYVKELADMLAKEYDLSMDYDDNSYFYKGGLSPKGIGPLFTISAGKYQGKWKAELRYGPLN